MPEIEEYKLAGHRFDQNTDRCVTCGKLRWRVVADNQCCYGKNSDSEDEQLSRERDMIWRFVVETARGCGRADAG